VAAKIWRHAGRVGVSYSDHYEEKGIRQKNLWVSFGSGSLPSE
jgi:hypothetical protein